MSRSILPHGQMPSRDVQLAQASQTKGARRLLTKSIFLFLFAEFFLWGPLNLLPITGLEGAETPRT